MTATRGHRRVLTLLALALAVIAGFLPAAAQSGSEAVVCVGSERRTLATNPIRRVYTEDMEVVYRIGADIGQRDQVERDLRSELGSYPEVWCAWSGSGDDHAVVISYAGVIRQDLTVDPEDPRFQAFSVGFGTDFDAAETQATTINQRFSSQSDGSGYEVLLRETWGVAEGTGAAESAPEPDLPDGPICTDTYSLGSCWMELLGRPGCYLWNFLPQVNETVAWSGACSNGFAQGDRRIGWFQNDELSRSQETRLRDGMLDGRVFRPPDGPICTGRESSEGCWPEISNHPGCYLWNPGPADGSSANWSGECSEGFAQGRGEITWQWIDGNSTWSGLLQDGTREGTWTLFYESRDDNLVREVGPYVDGERHGTWTFFLAESRDHNVAREVGPYVNGERHGTWTGYGASGNVAGTLRFENGKQVP